MKKDNICFYCRKKGHALPECPERKTTVNRNISVIQEEESEESQVEYLNHIGGSKTYGVPAVKKLKIGAIIPTKGSPDAAGYDLYAIYNDFIKPREQKTIPIGIAIKCPHNTYGRIADRSSVATRGLAVKAGVIDANYTGEIKVMLRNDSNKTFGIRHGDRIAQIIFEVISNTDEMVEVQELPSTKRGSKGFGSTNTEQEQQKEESSQTTNLSREEKFYQRIIDGFVPSGRCPHRIGMYSSSMIDDCWSCRAEIHKRQMEHRQTKENKEESQEQKIEELRITKEGNEGDLLILDRETSKKKFSILIDSGASGNFISKKFTQ
jgi:dUTP pyrophosphatase